MLQSASESLTTRQYPIIGGALKGLRIKMPNYTMVVFIVHGFGKSESEWPDLRTNIERGGRVSNWLDGQLFGGYSSRNYLRAVSNTRVMGVVIANLMGIMSDHHKIPADNFQVIGFSLGAQTARLAGNAISIEQIGAILALDPAGTSFDQDHLTKEDASYVEVIHTSSEKIYGEDRFSMLKQMGHIDFYVNDGILQPQCTPLALMTIQ